MKRCIIIVLAAACFCLLLSGCFDDEHYYPAYDYDALERFCDHYSGGEISEYIKEHYSLFDIVELYGRDEVTDYVVGMGWTNDETN